jgi:hypothetical protein
MSENKEPVIDPEWVDGQGAPPKPPLLDSLEQAVGPVVGGLIIDSIDLFSFGPLGLLGGTLIGGSVAYCLAGLNDLPVWQRTLLAIVAGIYCAIPFTNFIPAATIVGVLLHFFQSRRGA